MARLRLSENRRYVTNSHFRGLQHSQGTMVAMVTSLFGAPKTSGILKATWPAEASRSSSVCHHWFHVIPPFYSGGHQGKWQVDTRERLSWHQSGEGEQVPRSSHIIVFYAVLMFGCINLASEVLISIGYPASMESNSAIFFRHGHHPWPPWPPPTTVIPSQPYPARPEGEQLQHWSFRPDPTHESPFWALNFWGNGAVENHPFWRRKSWAIFENGKWASVDFHFAKGESSLSSPEDFIVPIAPKNGCLKALNPWRIPLPPSKVFQSPTLRLQSQQMQLLSPAKSITTLRLGAETCRREVSGTNLCWCLKHARYWYWFEK